ncbi:LuxR C-terminal-related transcriptional regulator [Longispora sp. K20-0274]|uniref:helix-turn-helix transcriptional regulator n=1 Tax=Longispora sp. K20-0274 TaxID=3088255 RepID=UPI00399A6CB5
MSTEEQTITEDSEIPTVYSLLLKCPELDAQQLARMLGRTEDHVHTVLAQMSDLSLLHDHHDGAKAPMAAHPVLAMQHLIAQEQAALDERTQHLHRSFAALSSALPQYAAEFAQYADPRLCERIEGISAVRHRLQELAVNAREEVLSFNPTAANPTATRAASRPLDLAVLDRGVRMRRIYPENISREASAWEYAKRLTQAGAEVRVAPSVPLRLLIVDQEVGVVPLNPDNPESGAIVAREPGLLTALVALFESYWPRGRTLADLDGDSGACSPLERSILRLLGTGAKDEAVARQLGLSVRTVRRSIADLMDRLQATSRFALAIRAFESGWSG